jgi:hypothetical protein
MHVPSLSRSVCLRRAHGLDLLDVEQRTCLLAEFEKFSFQISELPASKYRAGRAVRFSRLITDVSGCQQSLRTLRPMPLSPQNNRTHGSVDRADKELGLQAKFNLIDSSQAQHVGRHRYRPLPTRQSPPNVVHGRPNITSAKCPSFAVEVSQRSLPPRRNAMPISTKNDRIRAAANRSPRKDRPAAIQVSSSKCLIYLIVQFPQTSLVSLISGRSFKILSAGSLFKWKIMELLRKPVMALLKLIKSLTP